MNMPLLERTFSQKDGVSPKDIEHLFDPQKTPTWELIEQARQVREQTVGNQAHLCMILNAKSGACSEDCAFCSQSIHHSCNVAVYPMVTKDVALKEARKAEEAGIRCFGLVTSGREIKHEGEKKQILEMIAFLRGNTGLEVGLSPGLADLPFLRELKEAGLSTFHHNLETAPSFYEKICTTHLFEQRLRTVYEAKEAGLRVCSGGIFGLGESLVHRAELAMLWKKLPIDRIPVNFLNPVPGTMLEKQEKLKPIEALHTLAALRKLIPDKEILVCGGRDAILKSLQPFLFSAGADGIMTGNYLTTPGNGVAEDQAILEDLNLSWHQADS